MKKTFRTIAVFGLLGLAAVGCTKEYTGNQSVIMNESEVYYTVGGQPCSENLGNDAAWDAFLVRMLALARGGYEVTIFSGSTSIHGTAKEIVTYTTKSETDAVNWMKEKLEQGYEVSISYDDKTGIYTCTAVK